MTKAHYARSIKLECELEKVKKQRDSLLKSVKELRTMLGSTIGFEIDRKTGFAKYRATEAWAAMENADTLIAAIKSTKGELP